MSRDSANQPNGTPTLEATREVLRRELNRTSAAMGVILVAVIGLALAAILAGTKATRNLTRAEQTPVWRAADFEPAARLEVRRVW